jgi:hypothetical protein
MIRLTVILSFALMSFAFAESKSSCKKKGYKFDKKNSSCKSSKISKRKRCERKSGTWNEDNGKCEGVVKLKSKEKRALKLVKKAAKKSKHGKKLTGPELIELAKDLAKYAKKKKVRLKKIKISFDSTGKKNNTTAAQLKSGSKAKLYHIDEGADEKSISKSITEIEVETETRDITVPTNFFPPNLHKYTAQGKQALINAIVGDDDSWSVFNIRIVESSASKLANTGGDYKFSRGASNSKKIDKLKGLALARSNSTKEMLAGQFKDLLIINDKKAIVSGPADVFGTGDSSGDEAPSDIKSAAKNLTKSNRKKVSEFYNKFQYVKLKVEYMKETKVIKKILTDEIKEIPNAEGILAQFSKNKKYKKLRKRSKFKLKFRRKKKTKRHKPKRKKGKKYKPLLCPKW